MSVSLLLSWIYISRRIQIFQLNEHALVFLVDKDKKVGILHFVPKDSCLATLGSLS
jgi:hypothetical protein